MIRASLSALASLSISSAVASAADLPPLDKLPATKLLRDPMVFLDGSKVNTRGDWQRRREELKRLFQHYQYGTMPPKPESIAIEPGAIALDEPINARVRPITLTMKQGDRSLTVDIRLILPRQEKAKYPVMIRGTFGRRPGTQPATAPATLPAGMMSREENIRFITSRGYAIAEFPLAQIAVDNRDAPHDSGVYTLFDDLDAGTLMAWAWGFSRVLDALEKIDVIDATKNIVTGHSRWGKATLLAGAFDERIVLTAPSHSGAGGTAPYRFLYETDGRPSEALHNIVGAFPYWFKADFNQFIGHVEQLPFDQHELRALVAPRPQLSTEGTLDSWVNPEGSQLTFEAALKVYAFLGATDDLAIRYREVGHIPSDEDVIDFADHLFFEKPLPDAFNVLPYPKHDAAYEGANR